MRLFVLCNSCPKRTKGSEGLTDEQTDEHTNQVKSQSRDFLKFICRLTSWLVAHTQVHIEFTDGEDKITVEGPPEEVEEAKTSLEELTKELVRILNSCPILYV